MLKCKLCFGTKDNLIVKSSGGSELYWYYDDFIGSTMMTIGSTMMTVGSTMVTLLVL